MNSAVPLITLIGVLGLAVGSFLNVVIHRVPRGESVVRPASHCPTCNAAIRSRENIPVLSWLALRGRCAHCHAPISVRYPLVEAATGALFVAVALRFGLSLELPAYLFLAALAVTLALIDWDTGQVPNSIMLPSYIVALLLLMLAGAPSLEWASSLRALAGMAALSAAFLALALLRPRQFGLGEVKIAGLLGLFLGWLSWSTVVVGVLGAVLVAAAVAAVAASRRSGRPAAVPLTSFLLGAGLVAVFAGAPIWAGCAVLF